MFFPSLVVIVLRHNHLVEPGMEGRKVTSHCGTSCLCSFSWSYHLWYLYNLFGCLYHYWHCLHHYWHYRQFHSTPHYFLCLHICALFSLFNLKPKAPFYSTLFFLLRALLQESTVTFFLFSRVVYISSLILLTLVAGFCGFSF